MFKVVECDVLVVGGGIGGPIAALAAREEEASVVLDIVPSFEFLK